MNIYLKIIRFIWGKPILFVVYETSHSGFTVAICEGNFVAYKKYDAIFLC